MSAVIEFERIARVRLVRGALAARVALPRERCKRLDCEQARRARSARLEGTWFERMILSVGKGSQQNGQRQNVRMAIAQLRCRRGISMPYARSLPRVTTSSVKSVPGNPKMKVTTFQNVLPVA